MGKQILDIETGELIKETQGYLSFDKDRDYVPGRITIIRSYQVYVYVPRVEEIEVLDPKTDEILTSYPLPGIIESAAVINSEGLFYVLVGADEASFILAFKLAG